jgi:hypothetical protein
MGDGDGSARAGGNDGTKQAQHWMSRCACHSRCGRGTWQMKISVVPLPGSASGQGRLCRRRRGAH